MSNSVKTVFLFSCMAAIFIFMGKILVGNYGVFLATILAIIMNFFGYWFSDKIVLKMYKAQKADRKKYKNIHEILERLSLKANVKKPSLYVIDVESPNAFATGRNQSNSAIAITKGLVKIANIDELTGVLAHELAHIKNKDILIGTVVAIFAAAIMGMASILRWSAFFGNFDDGSDQSDGPFGFIGVLFVTMLATVAASLIQLAISRNREYLADEVGSIIVGNPFGLISALQKISSFSDKFINSNPSTAHMLIFSPSTSVKLKSLFLTHPPLEKRIEKLLSYNQG